MRRLAELRTVEPWERKEGSPSPLGATWVESEQAWNFATFSRHATSVTLLLYGDDPVRPSCSRCLHPIDNKTGRIWHCMVPHSEAPGARYWAWRVDGPADHRFDAAKILLDPFAVGVYFPPDFSRDAAAAPGPNDGRAPLGLLPREEPEFDWRNAPRPRHTHDTIVYELHVKGFTARASSGVAAERRGTFLGVIDKIPYLRELGVTVVELLPIQQFDPREDNYWGYMTLNFFTPHGGYAVADPRGEFQQLVRALHEAGIELWLDVVYNHTAEGGAGGPTYSMRGLDDHAYYLTDPDGNYRNDTGCGNTTRCAHSVMRALVLRSLQYWVEEMAVDGFRFDLASVFARDMQGGIDLEHPAMVHEIGSLANQLDVRVIAEAWDISAYLLGRTFPGLTWLQWNGQFRDDVRAFVRGDGGKVGALMTRLYGSDDLFPDKPGDIYHPYQSVNFVTAHDGFCLWDLVSYDRKHNEANGHGNSDGTDHNLSWNCGHEGDEGAPAEVVALRRRQVKNFFTLLMIANGTPMFCAGDEFLNTQRGNNNPYNRDDETTWLDWDLLAKNGDMFRFFRALIAFRKARRTLGRSRYWRDDVHWYGPRGPVEMGGDSRSLAFHLRSRDADEGDLYVMIHAGREPCEFTLFVERDWGRAVDTARESPDDVAEPGSEAAVVGPRYRLAPHSVVVLVERGR